MYHCLHKLQLNRLHRIQNAVARAVLQLPGPPNLIIFSNRCTGSRYIERSEYKVIYITYKLLQSSSPRYLSDLITVQPSQSTRSSTLVTLLQPPIHSSLKIMLFPALCTSLVEQASSYVSYSLAVSSTIISLV